MLKALYAYLRLSSFLAISVKIWVLGTHKMDKALSTHPKDTASVKVKMPLCVFYFSNVNKVTMQSISRCVVPTNSNSFKLISPQLNISRRLCLLLFILLGAVIPSLKGLEGANKERFDIFFAIDFGSR